MQGYRAFLAIEGVDIASHPLGHAFNFIRHDAAAGGHHQPVIGITIPLGFDLLFDRVNLGYFIQDKVDSGRHKFDLGLDAVRCGVNAKRNKEPAGLVVVLPITVDNGYLPVLLSELLPHFGSNDGAAGAMPQDN